jgi:quinoprotein glucose dehydrogenase
MTFGRKKIAKPIFVSVIASALWSPSLAQQEWPATGGDAGGMRYSGLTTINRTNVHRLQLAWTWKVGESSIRTVSGEEVVPSRFETTPVMVDNKLYLSTPLQRVVALDAATGRSIWAFNPQAFSQSPAPKNPRTVHRGVAVGVVGGQRVVFMNTRWRLLALSADTGQPVASFGRGGEVDLADSATTIDESALYNSTSPPVLFENLVIVGISFPDEALHKERPQAYVQAFDARTGRRVWRFNAFASAGEDGGETWQGGSAKRDGLVNVWAPMTVDAKRGLLYLPVAGPANDFYGGERVGDNLYAGSIVCLDARTGKRVWHFQSVHHGLWDYDVPAPPLLFSSRINNKQVDGVAVLTKMGFVFAFDRSSGTPLWPIQERPVPQSDVPGEVTSRTQPFPTLPAPFAKQGFSIDDVVDFTPEIRAAALKQLGGYRMGSLYTPPSLAGTVMMPGWIGGSAWGGGAFDPENATLYVKATNAPSLVRLVEPANLKSAMESRYIADHTRIILQLVPEEPQSLLVWLGLRQKSQMPPIPINKPPYGTLTAIDMNTGRHRWQIVVGDEPELRSHPLLRGVKLPQTGAMGMGGGSVTRGGLVFVSGGGATLYAIDKDNGRVLWEADLGGRAQANPMTYQTRDGRQFVVIAVGERAEARLMAFALPSR